MHHLAHRSDSMLELRIAKYLDLHLFSLRNRVVIANIRASSSLLLLLLSPPPSPVVEVFFAPHFRFPRFCSVDAPLIDWFPGASMASTIVVEDCLCATAMASTMLACCLKTSPSFFAPADLRAEDCFSAPSMT